MADVSFHIRAVDATRAAFLSVQTGLQRLNQRAADARKNFGFMGAALGSALGLNMQSMADFVANKTAGLMTGVSDKDLKLIQEANILREAGFDIADERRIAAMSDEQQLARLLKQETQLRATIASIGGNTLQDTVRRATAELSLQEVLRDQDGLKRTAAEDAAKLREAESGALKEMAQTRREASGATGDLNKQMRMLNATYDALADTVANSKGDDPKSIATRTEAIKGMTEVLKQQRDVWDSINQQALEARRVFDEAGGTMAASFENAVFSGGKLRDMLKGIAQDLMRLVFQNMVTKPLAGYISGGLMAMFGGGKAAGGSVGAGTPYMVGENGPELFTPSQAGRIIPNHRVGAGGGGGGAIVVQQTNNFSSGIQGVQLASMLEQSRRATIAEIQSLNQRRKVRFA